MQNITPKNRFLIIYKNLLVIFYATAITVTIPLQFLDFLFFGTKRIGRFFEFKIMKQLFEITDLKKPLQ